MRAPHLPDDLLAPDDVPPADAPVAALLAFAHSYHAYKVAGSLQRVAAIAVGLHDLWTTAGADPDAVLDAPVGRLRVALFHTARALDHAGGDVGTDATDDTETWLRVLVRSVAAAASGRSDRRDRAADDPAPPPRHGDGAADPVT